MAGIVVFASVGLRHQRIQPQQQAKGAERGWKADRVSQSDRTDSRRTEFAHHDGVNDALCHPAQFAQHHRNSQRDHRAQFRSPIGMPNCHVFNLTGGVRQKTIVIPELVYSGTMSSSRREHWQRGPSNRSSSLGWSEWRPSMNLPGDSYSGTALRRHHSPADHPWRIEEGLDKRPHRKQRGIQKARIDVTPRAAGNTSRRDSKQTWLAI